VSPANGSLLMAPPFPRSGPGESGSPTSQVILRCYDFPSRILGHLFVSLPRPTLPSSVRVSRLALALPEGQRVPSGPGRCSPATQLPVCSRVDVSGISQVPRRSVPCLCLVPGPRPNRRCLASLRFRRCCPRSLHSEGFSVMEISGLPRGFSTCCLRFTSGVATTHARLASSRRARLYRKGVEPSGSLQKVSDHSFSSSGFILAQEGTSTPEHRLGFRPVSKWYVPLSTIPTAKNVLIPAQASTFVHMFKT
jgi:hypothetical protein